MMAEEPRRGSTFKGGRHEGQEEDLGKAQNAPELDPRGPVVVCWAENERKGHESREHSCARPGVWKGGLEAGVA